MDDGWRDHHHPASVAVVVVVAVDLLPPDRADFSPSRKYDVFGAQSTNDNIGTTNERSPGFHQLSSNDRVKLVINQVLKKN